MLFWVEFLTALMGRILYCSYGWGSLLLLWVRFLTNLTNRILILSYGLGFPTATPGRVPKFYYEKGGRAGEGGGVL